VHFGVFEVDTRSGELRKSGLKIKLQDQPLQVLSLLLERRGELVTREEIQKKLWPTDTFVDFEHSLNTAITKLRQALGDDADNPRFIETLPRRGYRFVGSVNGAHLAAPEAMLAPAAILPHETRRDFSRVWANPWGIAALAIVLIAISAGFFVWQKRHASLSTQSHIESVAVLPLDNLSGDPSQEYFVDGMTDLLINDFSKIGAVRVISRTSVMQYKGARKPLPEIGRELNVDAFVEGAVLRSGNRVRITAQLLDAKTEKPLWADTYEHDVSDVLKSQADAAQAIADQVLIKVTPQEHERLAFASAVNIESQEDYFKGRFYWNKVVSEITQTPQKDLDLSVEYFQEAINKDPHNAAAYVGLADSYITGVDCVNFTMPKVGYPKAKAAAMQALAIDNSSSEAHASLAKVLWLYDWNWVDAEKEFKRAIELSASNQWAHTWYANYLAELGRFDEAMAEIEIAHKLDPVSLWVNITLGSVLELSRKYDQAIDQFKKTLEMYPTATTPHFELMSCNERKGIWDESVAASLKHKEMGGTDPKILAELRAAYAKDGIRGWWRTELETAPAQGWANDCNFASLYALLGEKEHALTALENAYDKRAEVDCGFLRSLKVNPVFDDYRKEPRFQALERKIGLIPN
jgi:TolB-like protein/DNA-binding winged helix-turn-helix (wHTH) protein